ncbi:MAG: hypothetical protein RJA25_1136 [Bacteroidota bacterium]
MSVWKDIKWQYVYGSNLIRLILINIAIFLVINLITLPFMLFAKQTPFDIVSFLSLYASPHNFIRHPWGIFTYMFVQDGFWHILWNMLALYWFGQILQDLIGKTKILPLYIYGGIFGGLMYVLAYNIFPAFSETVYIANCIGASASVMAIAFAAATIAPDYELRFVIFGNIKIKWIVFAYLLFDLIDIQHGNAGGHISHIGGALFGYLYIYFLRKGTDLARPFYTFTDYISNLFSKEKNLKVEYKKEYAYTAKKQTTHTAKNNETINKQARLDEILDKINRSSYDSLTKEEKEFLFKISQEE